MNDDSPTDCLKPPVPRISDLPTDGGYPSTKAASNDDIAKDLFRQQDD